MTDRLHGPDFRSTMSSSSRRLALEPLAPFPEISSSRSSAVMSGVCQARELLGPGGQTGNPALDGCVYWPMAKANTLTCSGGGAVAITPARSQDGSCSRVSGSCSHTSTDPRQAPRSAGRHT